MIEFKMNTEISQRFLIYHHLQTALEGLHNTFLVGYLIFLNLIQTWKGGSIKTYDYNIYERDIVQKPIWVLFNWYI